MVGFLYGGYRYLELARWKASLEVQNAAIEQTLGLVKGNLGRAEKDIADLSETLRAEQGKNATFEAQIREISGVVGLLEKRSKIDPELLKKYSRVYFLSENYAPAQLSAIDTQYLYNEKKSQLVLPAVRSPLENMLAAAQQDGVPLRVISAFRSFYEQASIKSGYKVIYGSGANQFSADQGYSEHQLGTTVDLTTPEVGETFSRFEKTTAYKWLTDNAHGFGFTLSYPKNNAYYQYEPWHWRFVGVALATKLHNENKYFYELTQREIDEYLITLFDP